MIWRSSWADLLPEGYIDNYKAFLIENISYFSKEKVEQFPRLRDQLEHLVFGRMQMCQLHVIPWIEKAVPLAGLKVVEIGAGQGSFSASLAMAGANLAVLDINDGFLSALKERFRLLKIADPEILIAPGSWIFDCPTNVFEKLAQADLVVMYALFEHLLPLERVALLRTLRAACGRHTIVGIMEAPNRFSPWDWHTSHLSFADIIPDQLYKEYISRSPKESIKNKSEKDRKKTYATERDIYRSGRGVSYHEFEVAVGIDCLDVILDNYTDPLKSLRDKYCKPQPEFEAGLRKIFMEMDTRIPQSFARPCIDMLFRFAQTQAGPASAGERA